MLALEAQQVVGVRMAKLLIGDAAANKEAISMVTEKVVAGGVAGTNWQWAVMDARLSGTMAESLR
jgi:hypothetical protein